MQLWEMPSHVVLKITGTDSTAPKEPNLCTFPSEDSLFSSVGSTSLSPCLAWWNLVQPARESGKCSFRLPDSGVQELNDLDNLPGPSWAMHHPHVELQLSWLSGSHGYMHACMCLLSRFSPVWLFATLWTVASQASLSMGFFKPRILERVTMPTSRESSWPRDRTHVSYLSCIGR